MEIPKPAEQHLWLKRLEGEWSYEAGAGTEYHTTGTERVRMLGDLWMLAEAEGTMPGGAPGSRTLMSLGYDESKGKFIGTWIGSMMTMMWVYEGELDAEERSLALYCDGPDWEVPGVTRKYRDTITLLDDDRRTLTSAMLEPDGSWKQFMEMELRRVR